MEKGIVVRTAVLRGMVCGCFMLMAMGCGSSQPVDSPSVPPRSTPGAPCTAPGPGEPLWITGSCVDPRYDQPYLLADVDQLPIELLPAPHYVARGGFHGTPAKFAFYFPLPPQYQGRFFQGPVHQLRLTGEIATESELRFAFDSGAYVVQASPLRDGALTARDAMSGDFDPTLMGYRLSAAAAKYSRVIAARVYGHEHRPFGYIAGGSGGAYMVLSSAEHTEGVWDGFAPFVPGHPLAIPNDFSVRLNALRVLSQRNKWPDVVDAVDPGGSGDPYATLNAEEAGALREATRLGFPLRAWYNHATIGGGAFLPTLRYALDLDPNYVDDFWMRPGYLGTDPESSIAAARVQYPATVVAATPPVPPPDYDSLGDGYNAYIIAQYSAGSPRRIALSGLPEGDLGNDFHLAVETGAAAGKILKIGAVDRSTNTIGIGGGEDFDAVNQIGVGDKVRVDNSYVLALQTYHRHQDPLDRDYYGWNQFHNERGAPVYPQRRVNVGPVAARNASGSVATGRFNGKMIMLSSLMDPDAFPWCADWYRTKATKQKAGQDQSLDDHYRLWFTDHAQHGGDPTDPTRTVGYAGVLQQALRDLSRWVEQGIPPPSSTQYTVVDSQVLAASKAAERRGIQPVVTLLANGSERAEVAVNQPVAFTATVEVPPGAGELVETEWNYEGTTGFPPSNPFPGTTPDPAAGSPGGANLPPTSVTLQGSYSYSQPGTYFAVFRATSQREGDPDTPHGRVQNIARVRIVVR